MNQKGDIVPIEFLKPSILYETFGLIGKKVFNDKRIEVGKLISARGEDGNVELVVEEKNGNHLYLSEGGDLHYFKLKVDIPWNERYNMLIYHSADFPTDLNNFYKNTADKLLGGKRQRKTKRRKQNRRTIKRRRRQ